MAIVITGASRGIGAGLHAAYTARGQTVVGTIRSGEDETGAWRSLDVTDPESVARFAAGLDSVPVDLLVCNAGVYPDKGMKLADDYPAEIWAEAFATNVSGVFLVIQALLPNLQMAESPRIAILSSHMASTLRAPGGSYVYRASKAAALNLGRNLATDLAPLGIAVGIYHPGWVLTEMGGPKAEITVEQSVAGLLERFEALTPERTGVFETWKGDPLDV
ncbi:MAG: SDR family oxidoreductase [Rhodobacteraceae bacterium]|nr:SDR family oxidoreductase [Paracoccaceae bacterium]